MGFRKDFMWGSASAAFQVEGAYNEDGKALGIWDALTEGHVRYGEKGDTACDHYHRYKEDVAIMKELGMKSYRFSVSWPRVMCAKGVVNEKGLQFYKNLVDELVAAGIEPLVTLYHWNLPMWMHELGGWRTETIVEEFVEYTKVVVDALSDKVTYWMTINEPQLVAGFGYLNGTHAPFVKEPENLKVVTRNIMLCHGRAVQTIREFAKLSPKIGFAPTGSCFLPLGETAEDVEEARRRTYASEEVDGNTWWADPIVLGQVPAFLQDALSAADMEVIHQPLDFFGFNIYTAIQYWDDGMVNPYVFDGQPRTSFDWPIAPECLYYATKFHYERYGLPILITENGMANADFVMLDGKVHDPQRTDFIHRYLKELKKAVEEDIPVIGYQYWSILDNFEWAQGYERRFGLVYVDFRTKERTIKDSAYFYAEVIRTNGECL